MFDVLISGLLALLKAAPDVVHVASDALRGGDTPEQAIAKARAVAPQRLDTTAEDEELRAQILASLPKP